MAWLGIIFIYMDMQDHSIYHVRIHFIPTSLYPRREEKQLELNPGPLASQATPLTTRSYVEEKVLCESAINIGEMLVRIGAVFDLGNGFESLKAQGMSDGDKFGH